VIATAWLWREVVPANRGFSQWLRWRQPVSLAVHLLVLVMLVVAMAEPRSRRPQHRVLLVDPAIGELVGADARERFERLKRLAQEQIEAMQSGDQMAILVAGPVVELRCAWTDRPGELRQALEAVEPRNEKSLWARSLAVARQMLAFTPGPKVLVVSAATAPGQWRAQTEEVEWVGPDHTTEPPHRAQAPWWRYLACVVLLTLPVEWWLFQRRWTC